MWGGAGCINHTSDCTRHHDCVGAPAIQIGLGVRPAGLGTASVEQRSSVRTEAFDVRSPSFHVPFNVIISSSCLSCPCIRMLSSSTYPPPFQAQTHSSHRRQGKRLCNSRTAEERHRRRRSPPPFKQAYWEKLLQPLTTDHSH